MRLFSKLYDIALTWAAHRHAPWYLAGLSFSEASFFPIPPDVMLAPMTLANRSKAWKFAFITLIASVLGGIFGYTIGYFAFNLVEPLLLRFDFWDEFELAKVWFDQWGFWVLFIAGFSPIPYKIFTIAAGVVSMSFLPFLVASIIGRGARFFLVAGIIKWGGEKMEIGLRTHIDRIGWLVVIIVCVGYLFIQFR